MLDHIRLEPHPPFLPKSFIASRKSIYDYPVAFDNDINNSITFAPRHISLTSLQPPNTLLWTSISSAPSLSAPGPSTPNEMFAKTLNRNLNLQRYKALYICGNYSSILSRLDPRFKDLEIRRAFTIFQLMTILEESRHF